MTEKPLEYKGKVTPATRLTSGGPAHWLGVDMTERTCTQDGCDRPKKSNGLCHKHHIAARRGCGKPETMERRFWGKVDRSAGDDACWLWTAQTDGKGYGKFESENAHRVAYRLMVGPIPDGLQIDHLCRVTGCVNPAHLEPVTNAENMRRRYAAQTHCKRGHEFTPENISRRRDRPEVRVCRTCAREQGILDWRRRHAPHLLGQEVGAPKTHCLRGHEFTAENTQVYTAKSGKSRRVCLACVKERNRRHYLARTGG